MRRRLGGDRAGPTTSWALSFPSPQARAAVPALRAAPLAGPGRAPISRTCRGRGRPAARRGAGPGGAVRSGAQRVKAAGAAARGGGSAAAAAGLPAPASPDRGRLSAAGEERAEPGAAAPSSHSDPLAQEDGDGRRELRARLLPRPRGRGGGHGGGGGNRGPGMGAGRV